MARREVIEQLGPLDEEFDIWFEDVDWCYRMWQAGWRLYCVPKATMTHYGGQSFASWSEERQQIQIHKSMLRFFHKHHGSHRAALVKWIVISDRIVLTLLDVLIGRIIDFFTGKHVEDRLRRRKALVRSLVDQRPG